MGRLAAIHQRGLDHAIRRSEMTFRGTGKRCSMKGAPRTGLVVLMFLLANVVVIASGRATAPVQEKPPEKPAAKSKDEPSADKSSIAAPATVKVEKGPFKVEVTLMGVFESARMSEVAVKPKAWSMPLVVEKAVELGTPVKQGDILVELDREKIDKAIQDAEVELSLGELSLKHAEEELPDLEKLLPIDLAAAERAKTQADEDLSRFLEIDRPNSEKMAQFSVKSAVEYLEYAKEELRQLEKMYRSKDLTVRRGQTEFQVNLKLGLTPQQDPTTKENAPSSPPACDPCRNPSYPQRTHFAERPQLEETLRSWEQKISNVTGKLTALGNHPGRTTYERLFHQMQGARDQMAEAVRRMPLETGALYEEDRERFEAAVAALGRLFQSWDDVKT